MLRLQTTVLFSANSALAHIINKTFYNDEHYVWCSPVFDPKSLDATNIYSRIPPSSSPYNICCLYQDAIDGADDHCTKIKENRAGLIRGASLKLEDGVIDLEDYGRILAMVEKASFKEFKPLVYVIPLEAVRSKVEQVPVKESANPLSFEYRITGLNGNEFEIMHYKR
jgi:hypothetical protein